MLIAGIWMNLEIITLSEVSQTEKDKHHTMSLIRGILKKNTNELIYKTEIASQRKQTQVMEGGGE